MKAKVAVTKTGDVYAGTIGGVLVDEGPDRPNTRAVALGLAHTGAMPIPTTRQPKVRVPKRKRCGPGSPNRPWFPRQSRTKSAHIHRDFPWMDQPIKRKAGAKSR
jgi:hypothetical protein